jgi:hypothetical protein
MRKIVVAGLLAMACASASAEWKSIDANAEFTQYINLDRLQGTKATTVKVGILTDYRIPKQTPSFKFLSTVAQAEYNCKEMESRSVYTTGYVGNMGKGDVVYSDRRSMAWKPITPGSIDESALIAACAAAPRK